MPLILLDPELLIQRTMARQRAACQAHTCQAQQPAQWPSKFPASDYQPKPECSTGHSFVLRNIDIEFVSKTIQFWHMGEGLLGKWHKRLGSRKNRRND